MNPNININIIEDPIQKQNNMMMQKTPYNLEEIFTQVCEYKVFLVNLKRAVLLGDKNFLKSVCLINSIWFNKWKKISCYEAIKDELNMCDDIQKNYKNHINNYIQILNNLQITEQLDPNIDNNSIEREYIENGIEIKPEAKFDIISPELWDTFTKNTQVNNGTKIEINISYVTKDSFEIKLGQKSTYIIFWNLNEQRLGKIIFKYKNEPEKFFIFEDLRNFGINNYYACFLEDLYYTKVVEGNQYKCVCINKNEFKKPVKKNNTNTSGTNHNHHQSQDNYDNSQQFYGVCEILPMGLENIFLTCYMNSSLQSLVNVTKLSNYFTSTVFNENTQILSAAYSRVVLNLLRMTPESQNMSYYSPKEFYGVTYSLSPLFQGMAGDAIDLINFFLGQIHEEVNSQVQENVFFKYMMNNVPNNPKIICLNRAINDFCSNNRSIITNLFYFIDKSKITCANCNNITYNFQFQKTLVFPLEDIRVTKSQQVNMNLPSIDIMDGFEHFQRNCALINDNMIYCNFCKGQTNAWQRSTLYSMPEYLIINLNRGKGKTFNVHINIIETININQYVESQLDNNNYRLISLITHIGQPGTSGHYIAFCFVEKEQAWFKFNDAIVERSSFQEAISTGDSYVLFYKRM